MRAPGLAHLPDAKWHPWIPNRQALAKRAPHWECQPLLSGRRFHLVPFAAGARIHVDVYAGEPIVPGLLDSDVGKFFAAGPRSARRDTAAMKQFWSIGAGLTDVSIQGSVESCGSCAG